jgi:hypothetical protein
MQKKLAGEGIGCFLVFMSSSSYPGFAARRVALLGGFVLGLAGMSPASAAIVAVTLQQGSAPASPSPTDYGNNPNVAYYGSYNFPTATSSVVRFSFTDLFLYGAQFFNLTQLAAAFPAPGPYALGGALPLTKVELSVTLNDREAPNAQNISETWASDLVVLIAPNDGSFSSPVLQLGGGVTSFGANTTELWSESSVQSVPYNFSETKTLGSSVALSASPGATDPVIWLGHGFDPGAGASYGRWSGYLEFTFSGPSGGGSGVPDASRTGLLLAPGALLLLGLAGRARRRG